MALENYHHQSRAVPRRRYHLKFMWSENRMVAAIESVAAFGATPVIIWNGEREHEDGHEEEFEQLNCESADAIDESDRELVARDRRAHSNDALCSCDAIDFFDGVHFLACGQPPDGRKDILLKQVLAVEGDVQKKPSGGAQQM